MGANARRGEIEAVIGGRPRRLVLTLGSLAELEHAFAAEDLGALARRFAEARLRADDLVRLVGAGLRGAGEPVTDDELRRLPLAGTLVEMAEAAAALLDATFAGEDAPPPPRAAPAG